MSLLQWFSRKSTPASDLTQSSGLGHVDATVPMHGSAKGTLPSMPASSGAAASRKSERLERREKLYAVVRESMTSAGVLSSRYKFKVLSLDSRGQQYLIMMDLARQYAGEVTRLAEIETLIAHNAKSQHDILVTAVYWRVNEHVTTSGSQVPLAPITAPAAAPAPVPAAPAVALAPAHKSDYDPIGADEMAAFKQALASAPEGGRLSAPGEIIRSNRRNPNPEPDFQDTELDDRHAPLSGTQYGDLI